MAWWDRDWRYNGWNDAVWKQERKQPSCHWERCSAYWNESKDPAAVSNDVGRECEWKQLTRFVDDWKEWDLETRSKCVRKEHDWTEWRSSWTKPDAMEADMSTGWSQRFKDPSLEFIRGNKVSEA